MPTMKDVAMLANVGVGTVSRVVNNKGPVKEKTRIKVEEAIEQLNYQPNNYARGLKLNRTDTIALIVPSVWHPFFSEFAYFVETELEKKQYKCLLCNSEANLNKEFEYIKMVQQNKVEGIIGISYNDLDNYVSSDLPFVSIDRHFSEDIVSVTADNKSAGRIAAQKLIEKGCQKLAYIGGYSKYPNETRNRKKYFVKEVQKTNMEPIILDMPEPIENPKKQINDFLRNHPDIDGIFTINDFMALEVIEVLNDLNKAVPDDVQVIGCDGIKLAQGHPEIVSTIKQPVEEMAIQAVESLLDIIHKRPVESMKILPVKFIDGKTTK